MCASWREKELMMKNSFCVLFPPSSNSSKLEFVSRVHSLCSQVSTQRVDWMNCGKLFYARRVGVCDTVQLVLAVIIVLFRSFLFRFNRRTRKLFMCQFYISKSSYLRCSRETSSKVPSSARRPPSPWLYLFITFIEFVLCYCFLCFSSEKLWLLSGKSHTQHKQKKWKNKNFFFIHQRSSRTVSLTEERRKSKKRTRHNDLMDGYWFLLISSSSCATEWALDPATPHSEAQQSWN